MRPTGAFLIHVAGSRTHAKHPLPRALSAASPRLRFLGGILATLAALTLGTGIVAKSFVDKSLPAAGAAPTPSQHSPKPAQTPPPAPAAFPTDDFGFINSAARCDPAQTALISGRTARSLVVICVDHSGKDEYRGVRISDGALLKAPAEADTTSDGGFFARKEGVTYAVSPAQLLVTSADTVINKEPMVEYKAPHPLAAETGAPRPGPKPTPQSAPAPTH
jgi:hypothetical protein